MVLIGLIRLRDQQPWDTYQGCDQHLWYTYQGCDQHPWYKAIKAEIWSHQLRHFKVHGAVNKLLKQKGNYHIPLDCIV